MSDEQDRKPHGGALRGLANFFRRGTSPRPDSESGATQGGAAPSRIGPYAVTGTLGRGGMGIVYRARDDRLQRDVAIKMMTTPVGDESARQRFLREARAAASVNHPNICHIHDIGEHGGELFLAMELLEGEPLSDRLRDGPLPVSEAIPIGLGILAALSALHARGIIHRDLKPSNVFLTPHGVKLLDFGLARPVAVETGSAQLPNLTRTGLLVGTPRYIAPEQVTGETIDGRCDLFAAGAILFEMLAGRPAFTGNNIVEILHATLHEHPPALAGSPAVAAVDRVLRHALAKRPTLRPASAEAMAEELRAAAMVGGEETATTARTFLRLVILPFRVLRPDPETDFLSFSLPDAIATSLSGFPSLIIRSTTTAARFGTDAPDLKAVAAEADVDRVVMGTLLRSGEQLRATAQLVEAPGGTLLTSQTVTASLGDLFCLQDDIARRVVDALALPLAGPQPTPDVPQDAGAYGLYLRANALARTYDQLPQARDLYQKVVEADPEFAPAWAQLGRCHRIIGKFLGGGEDLMKKAEEALLRALELSPRLTMAHRYYANHQADTGRALEGMVRLLGEASRHGNDPELFAGLVHACRYCGLYEQSIAAHEEARRLDPHIPTGVEQTLLVKGDYERILAGTRMANEGAGDAVMRVIALGSLGRRDEALNELRLVGHEIGVPAFRAWGEFLRAWLERRPADMIANREVLEFVEIMNDPEALFGEGAFFCDVGEHDRGLELLRRAIRSGFYAAPALEASARLASVRKSEHPVFKEILAVATAERDRALAAFREHGGERLLGRQTVASAAT